MPTVTLVSPASFIIVCIVYRFILRAFCSAHYDGCTGVWSQKVKIYKQFAAF